MHPFAFPLNPGAGLLIVFLLPDGAALSANEWAELRVARAALAADGIPERGASDLVTAASDSSVATLTTFLLTAGGSSLRARWSRRGSSGNADDWDFDKAWTKVQVSATAVSTAGDIPRLLSAVEDPASHEWRIVCAIGTERFLARADQSTPVVLWERVNDDDASAL